MKRVIEKQKPEVDKTILDTAKELVYGDRTAAYGHPKQNFRHIGDLQQAYLNIIRDTPNDGEIELSEIDVALLNILQKVARLAINQTHLDSIVDIAGYAATIERIIKNK